MRKFIMMFVACMGSAMPCYAEPNGHVDVNVVSIATVADYNAGTTDATYVTVPDCTDTVHENCIPTEDQNEIAAAQLNNTTPAAGESK